MALRKGPNYFVALRSLSLWGTLQYALLLCAGSPHLQVFLLVILLMTSSIYKYHSRTLGVSTSIAGILM